MLDTTDTLLRQIRLGEDSAIELKRVEYRGDKVAGPRRDSMADEMAAMANATSGVFFLGVDDETKAILGIPFEQLDGVESWLREIVNDSITPPLFCVIRKQLVTAEDGVERAVIRIDVPRSLQVHQSPGGYFYRVGSSKRLMTPDALARLFQQRSQARLIRFDEQAVPQASWEQLDPKLWEPFRTSFSPGEDEAFLLQLKLLTHDQDGSVHPSVGGVLMATPEPHRYIDNAYIQAVAYRGKERNAAYQLDAKDIVGPLDAQIAEAYRFVMRNMRMFATKSPGRVDIPQYSSQAVLEAIVNAVAHRDYSIYGSKIRLHMFSDRLVLASPGALPNTMTVESLALRQSVRNELLTSLLARCKVPIAGAPDERQHLMERRGEGVRIILSESEKLSGRVPQYLMVDDAELQLTIFAAEPPVMNGDE